MSLNLTQMFALQASFTDRSASLTGEKLSVEQHLLLHADLLSLSPSFVVDGERDQSENPTHEHEWKEK